METITNREGGESFCFHVSYSEKVKKNQGGNLNKDFINQRRGGGSPFHETSCLVKYSCFLKDCFPKSRIGKSLARLIVRRDDYMHAHNDKWQIKISVEQTNWKQMMIACRNKLTHTALFLLIRVLDKLMHKMGRKKRNMKETKNEPSPTGEDEQKEEIRLWSAHLWRCIWLLLTPQSALGGHRCDICYKHHKQRLCKIISTRVKFHSVSVLLEQFVYVSCGFCGNLKVLH